MKDEYVTGAIAVCMFIFFLIFMLMINPGAPRAHEWYSPYCCSGKDCAAASVKYNPDGSVTATNKFGTAKFSPKQFRPSKDGNFHACIHPTLGPRCLYVPAGV